MVWWPYATLFVHFYFSVTIQIFIQSFTHNIRGGPSPYLHSCRLSGRNLLGVPSRDSNSGQLVKHSLSLFPSPLFIPIPLTPTIILFPKLYTDRKENQIFLIYKEIQSGAVAKSYIGKGFLIYEEMSKYFPIYEEAVSHI
jgi:hypothetical protein